MSEDDPPVMQVHGDQDEVVPLEHARRLNERLKSVGVESELVIIQGADHSVGRAGPEVADRAGRFVREHLTRLTLSIVVPPN